jgi:hypothetical protein
MAGVERGRGAGGGGRRGGRRRCGDPLASGLRGVVRRWRSRGEAGLGGEGERKMEEGGLGLVESSRVLCGSLQGKGGERMDGWDRENGAGRTAQILCKTGRGIRVTRPVVAWLPVACRATVFHLIDDTKFGFNKVVLFLRFKCMDNTEFCGAVF